MTEEIIKEETSKTIKLSNKAIVVSSCSARQCHPETCCCGDNEAAIMDYIDYDDKSGRQYYGTIMYGDRDELETILNFSKDKKSLTIKKTTSIIFE